MMLIGGARIRYRQYLAMLEVGAHAPLSGRKNFEKKSLSLGDFYFLCKINHILACLWVGARGLIGTSDHLYAFDSHLYS